jgi:hypothetical protein
LGFQRGSEDKIQIQKHTLLKKTSAPNTYTEFSNFSVPNKLISSIIGSPLLKDSDLESHTISYLAKVSLADYFGVFEFKKIPKDTI